MTKFPRSKLITKIIVFALVVYAGLSLITLRNNIEAGNEQRHELRTAVADQEIINAQLEHDILHYDSSEVRANLARENLGLVLPGEIILFDTGNNMETED